MGDEALFARLRRLRREGTPTDEGADRAADRAVGTEVDAHERTLGSPEDLAEKDGPEGVYAERVREYAADHRHGAFSLDEVEAACTDSLATLTRDEAIGGLELSEAVYLDIETTGLGGGAGTIPFLVALGRFDGQRFELWQGFLRGPEEERAMLAEVAQRVRESSGVVSFFGKSFDRHRLEDKMRLHGVDPPFDDRPHLDLYHPCARLYREGFDDGRLQTMERGLCGVERKADLPGAFAPEAWYDFIAGRAHLLEPVFQHNADDVLSLVTLTAHLGRSLSETRAAGTPLPGPEGPRARGIARLLAELRRREEALSWVERAEQRTPHDPRPWVSLRADLLRLSGRIADARAIYRDLVEAEDEIAAHAWIELAKIAEHTERDPALALEACSAAERVLARAPLGRLHRRLCVDLEKRVPRLRERVPGA